MKTCAYWLLAFAIWAAAALIYCDAQHDLGEEALFKRTGIVTVEKMKKPAATGFQRSRKYEVRR
ncbi:hypothetical protein [Desulfococcus sp.]|uniref:hypothetical protein n=1 Tax=Desulfococcus sp. TaxID=2025834 RepID=UPI003593E545